MRIVADENIPFVKDAFSSFGTVTLLPGRQINRADVLNADMLLVRSVTCVNAELLEGTAVSFVATATIGIDHIDTVWLQKNGIAFAHAPGSNADSVAEYLTAALIWLERHFQLDLSTLTVGIVGVGNIGSRVSRHVRTLGMRPLLCDPPLLRQADGRDFRSIDEVLDEADIITFHVPLVADGEERTYHMVDERFLSRVKKGCIIINTSRGKVIDEEAVLNRPAKLAGLVLDVWENEPDISSALIERTVLSTPHIAGYSFDGKVNGTEAIYHAACTVFKRSPQWSRSSIFSNEVTTISGLLPGTDPLGSAVLQAYPIDRDSNQLRKILSIGAPERAHYFDGLRKNYQKRLEFRHFAVSGPLFDVATVFKLQQLGFGVVA